MLHRWMTCWWSVLKAVGNAQYLHLPRWPVSWNFHSFSSWHHAACCISCLLLSGCFAACAAFFLFQTSCCASCSTLDHAFRHTAIYIQIWSYIIYIYLCIYLSIYLSIYILERLLGRTHLRSNDRARAKDAPWASKWIVVVDPWSEVVESPPDLRKRGALFHCGAQAKRPPTHCKQTIWKVILSKQQRILGFQILCVLTCSWYIAGLSSRQEIPSPSWDSCEGRLGLSVMSSWSNCNLTRGLIWHEPFPRHDIRYRISYVCLRQNSPYTSPHVQMCFDALGLEQGAKLLANWVEHVYLWDRIAICSRWW